MGRSFGLRDKDAEIIAREEFLAFVGGTSGLRKGDALLTRIVTALRKRFPGHEFHIKRGTPWNSSGSVGWTGSVSGGERRSRLFQLEIKSRIAMNPVSRDWYRPVYQVEEPVYELGILRGSGTTLPARVISKSRMPTMRDVNKLIKEYGEDKFLAVLGGPMSGRTTFKSLADVQKFIRGLRTWFELDEGTANGLFYATRDNGDVGYEEAGRADIQEARRLRDALLAEYGAGAIDVRVEVVDEWVHLSVTPKRGRRASVRRVALRKINDDTEVDFTGEFMKISPIKAVKMDEAFEVETLEGTMKGKAGDWLAEGVEGERWPIDADIFSRTYKPKKASIQRVASRWLQRR